MLLLCFLLARIALLLLRFCFGCLKQIFGLVKFLQLFLPVFFVLYFAVYVRIKQVIIKVYLKKKVCLLCGFFFSRILLRLFVFSCSSPISSTLVSGIFTSIFLVSLSLSSSYTTFVVFGFLITVFCCLYSSFFLFVIMYYLNCLLSFTTF